MEAGNTDQAGYKVIIDARTFFLLLTASLLAILTAIAAATMSKKRKQKLEEPKHRMLEED